MVMSTIGKRVHFSNGKQSGTVEDEVYLLEEYNDKDFLDLIQYIHWDEGWFGIRVCYYYRVHGSSDEDWRFANRPLAISSEKFKKLLKKASKKDWF